MTLWSLNEAKKQGYAVDEKALADLTAWVLAKDDPTSGGKQLVAYLVIGDHLRESAGAWRHWLAARLPAHMIPAHFVELAQFPLTAGGKVDRQSLPASTNAKFPPSIDGGLIVARSARSRNSS